MSTPATIRQRALFGALLAGVMAVAIFSVSAIGILSRFIIDDLGISRTRLGWVVTAITVSAAFGSPLAGRVADRLGGRAALLLCIAVSAGGTAALGIAPIYGLILIAGLMSGFGQALANPSTNKAIVLHVAVGGRGVITGVKQSGVQAGAFIGGLVLPAAALALGWRWTMVLAAAAPLLLLAAVARLVPADPVRASGDAGAAAALPIPTTAWWLAAFGLFMGFGQGAMLTYLALFAQEAVGFSVQTAGVVVAVSAGVAVPLRIWWGRASERRLHYGSSLSVLAAGAVVALLAMWAAAHGASWAVWVGGALFGATAGSWNTVGMLAVMDASRDGNAGRASGVVLAGFNAGLAIGPPVFGFAVDSTDGRYDVGMGTVAAAFALALAVALVWWRSPHRPAGASIIGGSP